MNEVRQRSDHRAWMGRLSPVWIRVAALCWFCITAAAGCTPTDAESSGDTTADAVKPKPIWGAVGGALKDGTGFVDWQSGQVKPEMISGPQGGQHVWMSVRMIGMSPKKLRMTVEMSRQDNNKVVKPGAIPLIVDLAPSETIDQGYDYFGITAFVKCPCQVANKPLTVTLTLADLYGRTFETTATITPTWDGDCSLPPSTSCAQQ